MKKRVAFEVVRGSGNVFRDLGSHDAEAQQLKSVLAAQIIKVLDAEKLTVREAGAATGIAPADFSRIRQAKLDRFTVDRLMAILSKLGKRVDVAVKIKPRATGLGAAA